MKQLLLNDRFVLGIILLNAAIIFISGFTLDSHVAPWIEAADNLITVVFVAEAIVSIRHYGWKAYWADNWHKLDLILVLLALPSLIFWLLPTETQGLYFLLVFRVLRIFKFFKFVKFIPRVAHLLSGIQRAMKASVLIILAFFIFTFIVALITCFFFRDTAPEYFQNPLISLYSIFKVFTVEGWFEIPDALSQNVSAAKAIFIKVYFIVLLFFGGIFGLSLVNSIFVDSMVSDNNDSLEQKIDALQAQVERLSGLLEKSREND